MPLNEATRKPRRERHPLEFDLIGIPRTGRERDKLMQQIQEDPFMTVTNSFAVDKPVPVAAALQNLTPEQQNMLKNLLDSFISGGQGREFDLSKPPVVPYRYQAFPKMVYHHTSGHMVTVHDIKQLQAAQKKGFQDVPSPNHDYSQVKNGVAAVKLAAAARPATLTAEDLLADADEEQEAAQYEATDEELAAAAGNEPVLPETTEDVAEETRPRKRR